MSKEILEATKMLATEKGIPHEQLMGALEDALLSAYKKTPDSAKYGRVEMDRVSGDFIVYELVVPEDLEEELLDEAEEAVESEWTTDPETGERIPPPEPSISQEQLKAHSDQIEENDVTPDNFGRIAAQTAKQVILQRIREAERAMTYDEYHDRVGELVVGTVQQSDSRFTLVQLRERVEGLMPRSEQVDGERYEHGQRVRAVIKDVSDQPKGPSIILSRRDPELIKKLFELEVPEVADGLVEITNVARQPGYRSKIAVVSHAQGVDPVGACVGPRGSRVRMVVSELKGEKIDIIPYNEEPARFVAKALSPARVREVFVDDEGRQATVVVPDDQLSLAIGKEGLNARLAARLTGWRIDIRSETEFAEQAGETESEDSELQGRCAAVLTNGRRCPNAGLEGSRFCGLSTHQALARFETNHVAILSPLSDEDVDSLSNPDLSQDDVAEVVERAEAAFDESEITELIEDEELAEAEVEAVAEVVEEAIEEVVLEAEVEAVVEAVEEAVEEAELEAEVEEIVEEIEAEEELAEELEEEAEEAVAELVSEDGSPVPNSEIAAAAKEAEEAGA